MSELGMMGLMMLEGLYEEALGLPTDRWKVSPDDGAYKDWTHYVGVLKKNRLVTASTRKEIYAGTAKPMRITEKGKAEYQRIRASPGYAKIKADWESYREAWRRAEARVDAAFVKGMKGASDAQVR